jgi:hypothetical protein
MKVKTGLPATNPAPKPNKYNPAQRLTEAELADYARMAAYHNNEIVKFQDLIARHRNEILRIFHLTTVGSDLESISTGICGLCGFAVHEGECLDA